VPGTVTVRDHLGQRPFVGGGRFAPRLTLAVPTPQVPLRPPRSSTGCCTTSPCP